MAVLHYCEFVLRGIKLIKWIPEWLNWLKVLLQWCFTSMDQKGFRIKLCYSLGVFIFYFYFLGWVGRLARVFFFPCTFLICLCIQQSLQPGRICGITHWLRYKFYKCSIIVSFVRVQIFYCFIILALIICAYIMTCLDVF